MKASEALSLLRVDPAKACSNISYQSQPDEQLVKKGGACSIICSKLSETVFQLSAQSGNGADYFFPYLPGEVGSCNVPGNCPTGTIAFTGGMNGCALQVDKRENSYIFNHDANGIHLTPNESTVCRVNYRDYAGPPLSSGVNKGIGLGIVFAMSKHPGKFGLYLSNTIICVKHKNNWGVYSCGVLSYPDEKNNNTTLYESYVSSLTSCITTFE